jgi:anti-anti-sigma factor
MPPLCTVDVATDAGVRVVRLRGEVDLSNVAYIESQLTAAVADVDAVVVDLAALDYVDSSGLGMLERLARRIAVRLVVPDGAVIGRTLRVTGLDQLVPVFPDCAAAVAAGVPPATN